MASQARYSSAVDGGGHGDAQPGRSSLSTYSRFTREAFERVGGYAAMNSGQDMELDDRLRRAGRCNWPRIEVPDITYLFRLANGAHHLSGYGRDRPGATSGYADIARQVERAIAAGVEPAGEIQLEPRFRHDYVGMVQQFLAEESLG